MSIAAAERRRAVAAEPRRQNDGLRQNPLVLALLR
jgi:hypothetical protein